MKATKGNSVNKRKKTTQDGSEKRKQVRTKVVEEYITTTSVNRPIKCYKSNWIELSAELKKLKEEILKYVCSDCERINISCDNVYINSDYATYLDNSFSYYSYFSRFNDESVLNTLQYLFNEISSGIMFGNYMNNEFELVPFFNDNFENNWKDIVKVGHKYFAYKTTYLSSKGIAFDLENKERMICNINHIYSREESKDEIIKKLEYDNLVLLNLMTNLLVERKIPFTNVFFNIFRNGSLKEVLNEVCDEKNDIILRSHLYVSYCPIISFCKRGDCSDLIGISPFDWMLANEIIFDKNHDDKYIKSIKSGSEWIMKENSILYRGNICGIFDDMKNDLSYNVYKKLISLSPKNDLKYDFKLLKPSIDDYVDNDNCITYIKNEDVKYEKEWNIINTNKYKYVIITPESFEYIGFYIRLHCVLLIVSSNNNNNTYKTIYDIILQPNVHYIPIESDLSNIEEVINDIYMNGDKYSKMCDDAYEVVDKYLSRKGILDFYEYLFNEINKHYDLRKKEEFDLDYFSIDDLDYSLTSVPNNRRPPIIPKYKNPSCPCPRCKEL